LELDAIARQERLRYWPEFWWRWWSRCEIPPIHREVIRCSRPFAALDSRGGALDGVIATLRKRKGSLCLWGPVGSGKTLLATSALYAAAYDHALSLTNWFPCPEPPSYRFAATPHLLQAIRNTYGSDGSAEAVIDRYAFCRLLVLDDIGAESPTDWVRDVLYQIIDTRYCHKLPTILTSNLPIAKLESRLSDRIADRIVEMCRGEVIRLNVSSYRLQGITREEAT
jgi:DNA replication protein DnaC